MAFLLLESEGIVMDKDRLFTLIFVVVIFASALIRFIFGNFSLFEFTVIALLSHIVIDIMTIKKGGGKRA